jgi:hypothetical protein
MYLGEIEWCGMNWIVLTQDEDNWMALMNTVVDFLVPANC